MSKRPNKVPRWGYAAPGGALVDPPSGLAGTGWANGQLPPAPYFNALQNQVGEWIDFLRGARLSDWTRRAITAFSASAPTMAADTVTARADGRGYRIVAGAHDGTGLCFRISENGAEWIVRRSLPPAASTTVWGVEFLVTSTHTGGKWWARTGAPGTGQLFWTWPSDGTHTSGLDDDSNLWTQATLPGGTDILRGMASDPTRAHMVTCDATHIVASTDAGGTWANAALPVIAGQLCDVAFLRGTFVAITNTGEVLTSANAGGPYVIATTIGAGAWRLTTDGTRLLAYISSVGGAADLHVSQDIGATWTTIPAPATTFIGINRIRYADGIWMAVGFGAPYAWESGDCAAWRAIPLPLTSDTWELYDTAFDGGAWHVLGLDYVASTLRAQDAAGGTWAPGTTPSTLADAGYLRGRPVASTAPSYGDALVWNGSAWAPAAVSTLLNGRGLDGERAAVPGVTQYVYVAEDTGATYLWNAGVWFVLSAGGPQRCSCGTFSGANYLSSPGGAAEPDMAVSHTLIALLWPTGTPGGAEVLASHGDGATRGWQLRAGDNGGDTCELSLWLAGLNGGTPIQLTAATWAGATGTMHALAVTVLATGAIHFSWDGAAAVTIAAPAGVYVPPNIADTCELGSGPAGASPSASCELSALQVYDDECDDSELASTATAASVRSSGFLPVIAWSGVGTGDCQLNFAVARLHGQDGYELPARWKDKGTTALVFTLNGSLTKAAR
jgi:hypothetical protein